MLSWPETDLGHHTPTLTSVFLIWTASLTLSVTLHTTHHNWHPQYKSDPRKYFIATSFENISWLLWLKIFHGYSVWKYFMATLFEIIFRNHFVRKYFKWSPSDAWWHVLFVILRNYHQWDDGKHVHGSEYLPHSDIRYLGAASLCPFTRIFVQMFDIEQEQYNWNVLGGGEHIIKVQPLFKQN